MSEHLATAYPDETLRDIAYRMAEHSVTRMPVIARPRHGLASVFRSGNGAG